MTRCALLACLLAVLLPATARAQIMVTSPNDDGTAIDCVASSPTCTLRAAVAFAKADGTGPDTIRFQLANGAKRIALQSALDIDTRVWIDAGTAHDIEVTAVAPAVAALNVIPGGAVTLINGL